MTQCTYNPTSMYNWELHIKTAVESEMWLTLCLLTGNTCVVDGINDMSPAMDVSATVHLIYFSGWFRPSLL